jgi:hypothetical protein
MKIKKTFLFGFFLLFIIICSFLLITSNVRELFIDRKRPSSINNIYICVFEDEKIQFMYKPIVDSIRQLLKETHSPIIYKTNIDILNEISKNDVFIYVGHRFQNFEDLKKRNIYTIWYNTEPDTNVENADEIWTYSKYLFEKYNKKNSKQIIKFVPVICENTTAFVRYKDNIKRKLVFMGKFDYRKEKYDILMQYPEIKDSLIETYDLWNDSDYNNFIENNSPKIFINLTKSGTNALPSVRINKLLSHKGLIISEHTNEIDERLYEGIVYFSDIRDFSNVYSNLLKKTNDELQMESEKRYDKFKQLFDQKNAINLITAK